MATSTIPQTAPLRKGFSREDQYIDGATWKDYDLNCCDISYTMRVALERAILSGTNEHAFEILSVVGAIDNIPGAGKNFVPLNGLDSFYGVTEEYLKGVLARRGFIQKNYPDDILRVSSWNILRDPDVPLDRDFAKRVPGRDDLIRYRLSNHFGTYCVSFPTSCTFLIYSPRIALVTALFLLRADKSGEDTMAKRVALAIKRSDYRVIAANKPADDAEDAPIPADAVPIEDDGGVKLSRELIDEIVRIVTEVVLEQQAKVVEKQVKPDNWDDILVKWKYGKLSTYKAARAVGMSADAFYDYARGKKTFD